MLERSGFLRVLCVGLGENAALLTSVVPSLPPWGCFYRADVLTAPAQLRMLRIAVFCLCDPGHRLPVPGLYFVHL